MEQSALRDLWRGGPVGSMSPWSEVKALALRDAWCILEPGKERGMHQFIADHIEKAMCLSGKGGSVLAWTSFVVVHPASHGRWCAPSLNILRRPHPQGRRHGKAPR